MVVQTCTKFQGHWGVREGAVAILPELAFVTVITRDMVAEHTIFFTASVCSHRVHASRALICCQWRPGA